MSPFEVELSKIVKEFKKMSALMSDDSREVVETYDIIALQVRCIAAVERAAGRQSLHFARVSAPRPDRYTDWGQLELQVGVVMALLHDIKSGFMKAFAELVHSSMFSDFLEMASHLLDAGYKDAAAVIAGSTLEAHLRQLCVKSSIPPDINGRPKKADAMNSDLASAGTITKLDQKSVTAWLGLRNDAAHANYNVYDEPRVRLMIDGIRHFITVYPA
ncbi:hypothetical protein EJV47_00605 [Hymenobacter gummosus]|uniref:DUF4145 domain-containing protein n=1 Tax=Hymenobacter gummosus TaxID=1776032 RepID=A0A3S0K8C8_9BACT|nr:hypothetical protein [Hymenobacter gummosus]RTQ53272.1 hypothetical protein EJV47_00605 [Hymenobacter gummosus]